MTPLTLPDALVEQLQNIAEQEHRSVEDVLQTMIQQYTPQPQIILNDAPPVPDPLVGLIGLLDEYTNETDLSSTVRETLKQYSHPQYGWTKRGRTD
jgi:hypothetical protein